MAAVPIPRISWGWPVTITAGTNDVLPVTAFARGGNAAPGYVAIIAAGSYATPEALAAAVKTALEACADAAVALETFGDWMTATAESSGDGLFTVAIAPLDILGAPTATEWTASDATLSLGDSVYTPAGGRWYRVIATGTTGLTEPTSESNPVTDGTVSLMYLGRSDRAVAWCDAPPLWVASSPLVAGDLVSTAAGAIYVCTGAGTSGATAPTSQSNPVTDGTATLTYYGTTTAAQALGTALGIGAVNATGSDTQSASPYGSTITAPSPMPGIWSPGVAVRRDIEQEFEAVVTQVETAGGQNLATRWSPTSIGGRRTFRRVTFAYLPPSRVFADAATAAGGVSALETFWVSTGIGNFAYAPDRTAPTTDDAAYFLRDDSAREFKPRRMFDGTELYEITLEMGLFTS